MNLKFNNRSFPSLQEFVKEENDNRGSLYGKRLEFAHEIDSTIIKVLEATHIQNALNRLADEIVSLESGTQIGSAVVIDSNNFPEIYGVLEHCCKVLGIKIPHAVVSAQMPGINAYASGTIDNPYLLISDLATKLLTKEELTFILGHECGHLAMEHLIYHLIGRNLNELGKFIPVLGPVLINLVNAPLNTWSRCSEITADRAGFLCCGDLRVAQKALMKLESAWSDVSNVDLDKYIDQSLESLENMKLGSFKEFLHNHPLTPKRLKALQYFNDSDLYYRVTGKQRPADIGLLPDEILKKKVDDLLTIFK